MGSCLGTSGITISLHQENLVYFTDESLSGIVYWSNDDEAIRVQEISIRLIGEIGYTTQQTVLNGQGGTESTTQYNHVKFYASQLSLVRSQSEEEMMVFHQGQYSWPFEFSLTNYLPPTINSPQYYPHVRYYLQVIIEKSWYKSNIKEVRYLTIYPRIDLLANSQWLQPSLFEYENRKKVLLKGIINKTVIVPGQPMEFTIEIDNPKEVLIQYIELFLHQSIKIGPNSKRKKVFPIELPIENTKRQRIKEILSVNMPAFPLPPSYEFQDGIQRVVSVYIQYFLRLAVGVEGLFTNFDIDIPIIIATEPEYPLYQPSALFLQHDDLPPSYDSVQNMK